MKKKIFILEDDFEDFEALIDQLKKDYYCSDEDEVDFILKSLLEEKKDMTEELIKYDYFIIDIILDIEYKEISGLDFVKEYLQTFFNNSNKKIILFSDNCERYIVDSDRNKLLENNNIFFIEKETDANGILTNDIINKIKLKLDE